jgi:hypothetical protein
MNRYDRKKKGSRNKFWYFSIWNILNQTMVRERGVEPPHPYGH